MPRGTTHRTVSSQCALLITRPSACSTPDDDAAKAARVGHARRPPPPRLAPWARPFRRRARGADEAEDRRPIAAEHERRRRRLPVVAVERELELRGTGRARRAGTRGGDGAVVAVDKRRGRRLRRVPCGEAARGTGGRGGRHLARQLRQREAHERPAGDRPRRGRARRGRAEGGVKVVWERHARDVVMRRVALAVAQHAHRDQRLARTRRRRRRAAHNAAPPGIAGILQARQCLHGYPSSD